MNQPLSILWQDEHAMVLNKPAGMACLPLAGSELPNLAEQLVLQFPEQASISDFGLCHRLDNDTSGCVLVARNEKAYQFFRKAFQEQKVRKFYQALVFGQLDGEDSIDFPIAHHPRKAHKMMACATPQKAEANKARPALTHFRALKVFSDHTLLEVEIVTGARHQIRVHLAFIGCSIVGDLLYQKPLEREQDQLKLERLFLHACELRFSHPDTKQQITVTSELPDQFTQVLQHLKPR